MGTSLKWEPKYYTGEKDKNERMREFTIKRNFPYLLTFMFH